MQDRYAVTLLGRSRPAVQATFLLNEDATLIVEAGGISLTEQGSDAFESFCRLRERLEGLGYRPLCMGALRNVYPSAMSRDMGGGIKAYRLILAQTAKLSDLVDIFAPAEEGEPVTVAEQEAFFETWLESLAGAR